MSKHILLICGSMNEQSITRMALEVVGVKLEEKGLTAEVVDVAELALPVYNPMIKEAPAAIVEILKQVEAADAVVVGTPEYHGGYSGALKNLIDYLPSTTFRQKTVALIAAAGGHRSGINALNGLRLIFRNVHARCITEHAAVSSRDLVEDADGLVYFNDMIDSQLSAVADGIEREMQFAAFLKQQV